MPAPRAITCQDRVVLFPALASPAPGGGWRVTVEGRVFRPKEDTLKRRALVAVLARALGLEPGGATRSLFARRAGAFLVDSKSGCVVTLRPARPRARNAAAESFRSSITTPAGFFFAECTLRALRPGTLVEAVLSEGHACPCITPIIPIPHRGVSVVCDIDDTIKVTRVWSARATLRSTLLRPFRAVAGMPALLDRIAQTCEQAAASGTPGSASAFHYVSASPWQLLEPLEAFRSEHGFPPGSLHLRPFRFRAKGLPVLLQDPTPHKQAVIAELMTRWPRRRFVLLGDSAEQDAEVYRSVAQRFPGRVAAILIRLARRDPVRQRQIEQLLASVEGVPARCFSDPDRLDPGWLAGALGSV